MSALASAFMRKLASPHLMVAFFLLMAAAALGVAYGLITPTPAALLPLGLLVVNLTASIASNARFRADLPLLVFHVSLLVFVALVAVARLTYFEGAARVPVGERFAGELIKEERGWLHGDGARALRFSNEGFTEVFPERNIYRETQNRVRFPDAAGTPHEGVIGDDHPLVLDGYRIYTSRNRGFAPTVQWEAHDGALEYAALQLGRVGEDGFTPGLDWKLPSGRDVLITLAIGQVPVAPGTQRDNLGAKSVESKLVLHLDGRLHELRTGESIELPGGRLRYAGLSAWMGYNIIYDPTKPWLIGTIGIAIASLLWFYARRLWRTWDED